MPHSLDVIARHTLFILKEAPTLRKLAIPDRFTSATISTPDQILACVDRAHSNGLRLFVIVDAVDFQKTYELLKLRAAQKNAVPYGIFVIADDPKEFLNRPGLPQEFLEVISEKDVRKNFEFHLLRALRQLQLLATVGNRTIGPALLEKLNQIFISLSAERSSQRLLEKVLTYALDLAGAQAGVLYMLQEFDGEMYFKVKMKGERTTKVEQEAVVIRVVENSISGYVALTGKLLNVPDIAALRPMTLPQYNRLYDCDPVDAASLLTVPLKNSRSECVAVLQLVNHRRENGILPFTSEEESLMETFATQAAFCLENVDLYGDIQKLFEGFVKASITAIESRDPSTGGHSERVAKICVALARATTECEVGIYRSVKFKEEEIRELEYAAMLHDFGKIGVREEVLVKAKKLYSYQLEGIQERTKICKAAARISCLEKCLRENGKSEQWEAEYLERVRQIDAYWAIILAANEPTVQKKENVVALEQIRREQLLLPDGSPIALISEDEYKALSVTRGSLTESERLEIESHVRHTYQFLKMIPWTRDFKHLTEIAYCHHEKLDGTGYPRGLTSHEIPLQSKIMTIADIYDALTAADRWYKEAVPTEKALEILASEVAEGKLDPVLYELFVAKKIFEVTQPKYLHQAAS